MIITRNDKAALPILALMFSALFYTNSSAVAGTRIDTNTTEQEHQQEVLFSQGELAQMLAPVALYPDTLLTHILIAATYPLEVVEADRFVKKHQGLSEHTLLAQAEDIDWDPSVKALLAFPRILANLSEDLAWMQKLGDAFLQDEAQVLASIQTLRAQADQAGNLAQMDNVQVVREKQTIIIEPAKPEVVYVPYYDTRVVYGNWHWSHYPPVYWHRPVSFHYYHGPFYYHSGVDIAFDFFFSAFHWHNHHVVRHHHKKRYYHSNRRIATSHHAKRWHHEPKHRRGIAYRSNKVKHRYVSHHPSKTQTSIERQRINAKPAAKHYRANNARSASNKHDKVKQKLTLNRAIKVNPVDHSRVKLTSKAREKQRFVKPEKSKQTAQFISRKQRISEKAHTGKVKTQRQWQQQSTGKSFTPQHKQRSDNKVKSYARADKSFTRKNSTQSGNRRAQGGHSSKQYARVTKHSVSKHKSKPRHKSNN
ncbi:hypothetical protein tinsulaeT_33700 [Thalassotalea insulae]|uniref:DUF3300 domain-containing protein n=1 Tax=Thalassotalea insulae TaxID=2056778 RepID=A0ABQ6GZ63_9GAMM|nr:DUF3300 domain-containing protein [Thalassotalea insulae]GLX80030.1 hypothetical protein tinsulaeT_33700 [Thalassotalea insulae]